METNKRLIKLDIPVIKPDRPSIQLNDIGFRLILIPFFGIAIPIITNMVPYEMMDLWRLKFSFLYTIGIAWIVWEGNRFLLFTLRNYFDWYDYPLRKIAALILVIPFYTIPISVLLLTGWYHLFSSGQMEWDKIWLATTIILICVLFIVHVYETVFLVKEAESEKLNNIQLEKAKMEAELQALKNQIDPHFIFNSLNTLSHFIDENPSKARSFNQNLADVYRYILENRKRNYVTLAEELTFVQDYYGMLRLRFEEAIRLDVQIDQTAQDQYLVLPISIQLLVENAVKHNEYSDNDPLTILIFIKDNELIVRNKKSAKKKTKSSKIGLKNLQIRYELLTQKPIKVIELVEEFTVKLPLIKW